MSAARPFSDTLIEFGRQGLAVPLLLLVMLSMLVLPLPPVLLDLFFTFNISLSLVVILAVIYILIRIGHMAAYISGRQPLRSAAFGVAQLVAVAIFVSPLFR